ncbi:pickpocket protein 11-like [Condylostylus longicornis]|uniref:pickpocket protein 11-like n=1 Tax=Condylostylus longicornis TaxID=2530218 RepID=UPI00244DE6F6|nr:pickpocket protein 11-like [Condylostylus longicornis]
MNFGRSSRLLKDLLKLFWEFYITNLLCRNKISDEQKDNENQEQNERDYIINEMKSLQRKPKWYHPFLDCVIVFCDVTGIHGACHITNKSLPRSENIAWFVIVLTALTISSILLYVSWKWNDETPTKQLIDSMHAPVWRIPFPAVTICSNNRISKEKVTKLANEMKFTNYTPPDFLKLFKLTMGVKGGLAENNDKYLLFDRILRSNNHTFYTLMDLLTPKCTDLIRRCMWKGETRKCEAIFQEIETSSGKCCAFNYFAINTTTFPQRVILRNEIFKVPQRVTSCGSKTGLTLLIEPKTTDYFGTHFSFPGLKIYLHDSYDFPDENSIITLIPARTEAHVQITSKQTFATSDVREIKPKIRNCLFADEKKLNFTQKYSLINCLAECRSTFIYSLCNCIPDSLPRNDSMRLCQIADTPCILKHRSRYISSALPSFILSNKTNETKSNLNEHPCDCLPDCQINQYSVLSYANYLDRNFSYSLMNLFKGVEITDQILLHVYKSDILVTRYRTTAFQTWFEILASFGGLLGFVIGFSIVTVGEFIFAVILSPILNKFNV